MTPLYFALTELNDAEVALSRNGGCTDENYRRLQKARQQYVSAKLALTVRAPVDPETLTAPRRRFKD